MKMLLHACCGPCTLEPSRVLAQQGVDFDIYYSNANIHPHEEYARRLDTLRAFANDQGLTVLEGTYNPDLWEETAGKVGEQLENIRREAHLENELVDAPNPYPLPERAAASPEIDQIREELATLRRARCRACYRLRFEDAARFAAENGYDTLCSTLSVSPFQYTDVIREELERAAAHAGVQADFRDFRPYFQNAEERSRDLGMYRQNYCGCRLSDAEAAQERALRKAARKARKAARKAAAAAASESAEVAEAAAGSTLQAAAAHADVSRA